MLCSLCGIQILSGFSVIRYCAVIDLTFAVLGYEPERGGRISNMKLILNTRDVPKVMSNFFFLHANYEQQTKESAVVDGTSCCVILECLVTSIACIT